VRSRLNSIHQKPGATRLQARAFLCEELSCEGAHAKLTSVVGRLMAETGKMKTYSDAIEAILNKSVILSPELLDEVESFMKENAELGYATKEEFIQDAIRLKITSRAEQKLPSQN